jgi:hypothetical protein
MAIYYANNNKGLYQDDPESKAKKGEIAGRVRCMFDRFAITDAVANGDEIMIGGVLPPNCTIVDAWIGTDASPGTGVNLRLLARDTRTEGESEANMGTSLTEGTATEVIAATEFTTTTFVRMGAGSALEDLVGVRLGYPEGPGTAGKGQGTELFVSVSGGDATASTEMKVFVAYVSD